jgi:uncharacterized phiE125 gp8 family phage protein
VSILLVTLAETKTHLRTPANATDSQLTDMIEAASAACEQYTGRTWTATTITAETHSGGRPELVLLRTPVASVTTVVESGVTLASTDWVLDAPLLWRGTSTAAMSWAPGRGNIAVTYVAGPATVPDTIKQGVLEHVRHLWTTQLGGTAVPRAGADMEWSPEAGEHIPRRVAQLWRPHRAVLVR